MKYFYKIKICEKFDKNHKNRGILARFLLTAAKDFIINMHTSKEILKKTWTQ